MTEECMHGLVPEQCGSCRRPASRTRTDLEVSPQRMLHTADCSHWRGEDRTHWAVGLPPGPFDDSWLGREFKAQDGTLLSVRARCKDCG